MNVRWNFLLFVAAAVSLASGRLAMPATLEEVPTIAAVPNFSGVWRQGLLPWFIPPAHGPGPVTNLSRRKDTGQSNYGELVGDYTNPILQPWAAEVVKKMGDLSRAGILYPHAGNQCWPQPVPFVFKNMSMQMVQTSDKIVMLFSEDHEVRWVRLNGSHPAKLTPSWYGDAIGHYEGDALVVDTTGVKTDRPYGMMDLFGTPYTDKLHVVERYRLADYDEVKDEIARGFKENSRGAGPMNTKDYKDKYLRVHFTVEDPGSLTTPWTASMVYQRNLVQWTEEACAENRFDFAHEADVPRAKTPDF